MEPENLSTTTGANSTEVRQERNKIVINGHLGSGKTTAGETIAKTLGFSFTSTGMFFRQEAERLGMTFKDFMAKLKTDFEFDKQMDTKLKVWLKENDNFVMDSRMAACFEPGAFKVLLEVEEIEGATRILNAIIEGQKGRSVEQHEDEKIPTLEEIIEQNRERVESETKRYIEIWKFEHFNPKNYNLTIDTTNLTPEAVVDIILIEYKAWLDSRA